MSLNSEDDTIAVATYGRNPFDGTPIEVRRRAEQCIAEARENVFCLVIRPTDHLQINKFIASYLEDDNDLEAFRRTCRSANDAINGDGLSFWRRRFLSVYEKPIDSLNNAQYKLSYRKRRTTQLKGVKFKRGTTGLEKICLDVLRDLIVEAWSTPVKDDTSDELYSPNLKHLVSFLKNNPSLIQATIDPKPSRRTREKSRTFNTFLVIIQIIAAPCLLRPVPLFELDCRFPVSQHAVYATAEQRSIFDPTGAIIDMEWLLHQLSFWQYHMTRPQEYTLFDAFSHLSTDELPRFWSHPLHPSLNNNHSSAESRPHNLGKHWKGSYAFVDRNTIQSIRAGAGEDNVIQDEFNGENAGGVFQDLTLNPISDSEDDPESAAHRWPPIFENYLHSLGFPHSSSNSNDTHAGLPAQNTGLPQGPAPPRTRAQHRTADSLPDSRSRSFRFEGEGHDIDEDFLADGWLNPLPAQQGVPGWRRMTMMKYFLLDDEVSIDYHALWAYEGVVLPGGEIVLGRWWCPAEGVGETMYSGPFILWCVDGVEGKGERMG